MAKSYEDYYNKAKENGATDKELKIIKRVYGLSKYEYSSVAFNALCYSCVERLQGKCADEFRNGNNFCLKKHLFLMSYYEHSPKGWDGVTGSKSDKFVDKFNDIKKHCEWANDPEMINKLIKNERNNNK